MAVDPEMSLPTMPTGSPSPATEAFARYIDACVRDFADVDVLPGAAELISSLPPSGWAVVTSGTRIVTEARMAAAGLPRHRCSLRLRMSQQVSLTLLRTESPQKSSASTPLTASRGGRTGRPGFRTRRRLCHPGASHDTSARRSRRRLTAMDLTGVQIRYKTNFHVSIVAEGME